MRERLNLAGVIGAASVIAYYSLTDFGGGAAAGTVPNLFAALHVTAYFVLAAATLAYFHDTIRGHVDAFAVAFLFGASIEVAQSTIAYRTFSLVDLGYNAAGASVVFLDQRIGAVSKFVALEDAVIERAL